MTCAELFAPIGQKIDYIFASRFLYKVRGVRTLFQVVCKIYLAEHADIESVPVRAVATRRAVAVAESTAHATVITV